MQFAARSGSVTLAELSEQARQGLTTLSPGFRYFAALDPFTEEDIRDYLEDPVAALPPAVMAQLPQIDVLLVPYLERVNGREKNAPAKHGVSKGKRRTVPPDPPDTAPAPGTPEPTPEAMVVFDRPGATEHRPWRAVHWRHAENAVTLVLSTADQEVADYHYHFYRHLALVVSEVTSAEALAGFVGLIREELNSRMHGEVDEKSWQMKQAFLRHRSQVRRDSREFREYARMSFIDTMTLYLHGICCDIDVDTGPRQLPSRYLRRRLRHLQQLYPPPSGYAVFPEELDRMPTPE